MELRWNYCFQQYHRHTSQLCGCFISYRSLLRSKSFFPIVAGYPYFLLLKTYPILRRTHIYIYNIFISGKFFNVKDTRKSNMSLKLCLGPQFHYASRIFNFSFNRVFWVKELIKRHEKHNMSIINTTWTWEYKKNVLYRGKREKKKEE